MEYNFNSLKDKVVLITGGSGAIGLKIAEGFLQNRAKVIVWGHRPQKSPDPGYTYFEIELQDRKQIENGYRRSIEVYQEPVSVLVNCAGFTNSAVSHEYKYEMWQKTIDINLTAPFLLSQIVAKGLIENKQSGSIINITSIGAKQGFPNNPAYGASKGGLSQLSKAFACDWADYGIRVNNVAPGYTLSKMTSKSWENDKMRDERTSRTMLGKWAKPEDIVGVVLFLASDMAAYITGQDFYVDGGWTSKGL